MAVALSSDKSRIASSTLSTVGSFSADGIISSGGMSSQSPVMNPLTVIPHASAQCLNS